MIERLDSLTRGSQNVFRIVENFGNNFERNQRNQIIREKMKVERFENSLIRESQKGPRFSRNVF